MKAPYLVLRTRSSTPRARPLSTGDSHTLATVDSLTSLKLDVEELDPSQLAREEQRREHVMVAEILPLTLIAPVQTSAAPPKESTPSWGVTAVRADRSPHTGRGITVAVLDTGIDPTHPAFAGVQLIQKNFTADADEDSNGHGTHCAGTLLGRPVQGRRIGVAPGVRRALIGKIVGPHGSTTAHVMKAIQWAANEGAHVISISLGIDFPGYQAALLARGLAPQLAMSHALRAYRQNVRLFDTVAALLAASAPFGQPSILIASSGNESRSDLDPDYKIGACLPSASAGVISVGAVGPGGNRLVRAPFSNVHVAVVGPGVDIVSAVPGGGLAIMSGTSMATPHVAGVAALLAEKMAERGLYDTDALRSALVGSASLEPLEECSTAADVGSGLVQAPM